VRDKKEVQGNPDQEYATVLDVLLSGLKIWKRWILQPASEDHKGVTLLERKE
jgi:hypothetical protein